MAEGSYLNHDFQPTKGKTYSLMIKTMSYELDAMSERNLEDCMRQGVQYRKMVTRMRNAFDQGILQKDQPYFIFYQRNDLEKLMVELSYQHPQQAFRILAHSWDRLQEQANVSSPELSNIIDRAHNTAKKYDEYIFVPASPLVVARWKAGE